MCCGVLGYTELVCEKQNANIFCRKENREVEKRLEEARREREGCRQTHHSPGLCGLISTESQGVRNTKKNKT